MTTEEWDEIFETESPIDGLSNEQFKAIREQIIQYIKMYRTDGESIGAYKIMKLFEPFLKIQEVKGFVDMMKASFMAGNAEADRRQIAYAAWRAAADAFRMYPDNKHTFSDYWETIK